MKMEENLSGRLYLEMDPELWDFLERYVDSFVKVDLLHFFHTHPHSVDTVETIAHATGRDETTLQRELDDLAISGLLRRMQMGELTLYALVASQQVRQRLQHFIEANRDPRFRTRLIYYLVRGHDG